MYPLYFAPPKHTFELGEQNNTLKYGYKNFISPLVWC
jgi:hypothetical protein